MPKSFIRRKKSLWLFEGTLNRENSFVCFFLCGLINSLFEFEVCSVFCRVIKYVNAVWNEAHCCKMQKCSWNNCFHRKMKFSNTHGNFLLSGNVDRSLLQEQYSVTVIQTTFNLLNRRISIDFRLTHKFIRKSFFFKLIYLPP